MKRITLWLLSTVSVVVLLFGYDASGTTTAAGPPTSVVSTDTGADGRTGSPSTSSTRTATRTATSTGTSTGTRTATRTVIGAVASTQWGPVQVRLTVAGDTITGVTVLQQPNGNPRDDEINSYALPILTQEALADQGARIDMVSGATVTSTGYVQSLQSAIDRAGL